MSPKRPNNQLMRFFFVAYLLVSSVFISSHIHFEDTRTKISSHAISSDSSHSCPSCAFRTSLSFGLASEVASVELQIVSADVEQTNLETQVHGQILHWLLPGTRAPPVFL